MNSKFVKNILTALCIGIVAFHGVTAYAKDLFMEESEVYEMAVEIGEIYSISPELLTAIAYHESRYKTDAKNGGCIGLMQVNQPFHKDRMKRLWVSDLYDPYGNMLVAADYLAELIDEYQEIAPSLMEYHGESGVDKFIDGEKDMSKYARKILKLSEEMEQKNNK